MSSPITIQVNINHIANNAYEFTAVMKGRFYKRQYIGYSEEDAIQLFEEWLNDNLQSS